MTRSWIGVALLSASWLFGLGYFEPANTGVWISLLIIATVLLGEMAHCWPGRRWCAFIALLLVPAAWLLPLPYKSIAVLSATGLLLHVARVPGRWARVAAQGSNTASVVLLTQACALWLYELGTARHHELPHALAKLLSLSMRPLGIEAAIDGGSVAMRSMQEMLRVAATWELLADPATMCFLVGGLTLIGLSDSQSADGPFRRRGTRGLILLGIVAAWLPFRAALLLSLLQHAILRADPLAAPNVGTWLISGWIQTALLAMPSVLAARFLPGSHAEPRQPAQDRVVQSIRARQRHFAGLVLISAGVTLALAAWLWTPVGDKKSDRVMIVERHSTWEPTTEPYGTKVYGEAGSYNYAAAYAYCGQYFQMSRLLDSDRIDRDTLRRCDVLVIKTPTERYSREEVEAVVEFVRSGGSLLLIGDHTNVFNMSTYLNDLARHFAFTFRNDLLFRVGDPYKQPFQPPRWAHPVVQHLGPMHFAVSCSIDPGWSRGAMVIRSHGLWSLPPAYHESNYHPQAEYRPRMQYGAYCQLWATTHGRGRVLAFADSTIFSNFCLFQPGKAELLVSMLRWLNHATPLDHHGNRWWLAAVGSILALTMIGAGFWLARSVPAVTVVAIILAGWTTAVLGTTLAQRGAFPKLGSPQTLPHVVIDRTVSEVPLFNGAFAEDEEGSGYGMFEQWIPRLGNYISRRAGPDVFAGDGLVVICPTRSVPPAYQERLIRFVRSGGHVVVLDSIEVEGSTANSLLWPFGLSCNHATGPSAEGQLRCAYPVPAVTLLAACEIVGGEPLAWLHDVPVAARARWGKGTVTAIGFGGLFNDANMGFHWLPDPEPAVRDRYEVLYGLLRASLPTQVGVPRKR